ncbi:MAG: AMP-binding protein [Deltaproteobacteria bacterium]|nr:AMP-binding protein [Deltaproteobacteria bacterium]
MERSILHVFFETAAARGDGDALRYKDRGLWKAVSWRDYARRVRLVARGLVKLGLQKGGAVAITGNNCPEWLIADLATMAAGGVPAPIYTTVTAEQAAYIVGHSEATIFIADTIDQVRKIKTKAAELPKLAHFIVMRPVTNGEGEGVIDLGALEKLGEGVDEKDLEARLELLEPTGLATLIYTSGTTGPPKGVMLSHRNLVFTARAASDSMGVEGAEVFASYLPLSHIAEQMISIHLAVTTGSTAWFVESLDKLGDNLREIHPTVFVGVPRVWEKIQAKMMEAGAAAPPLRKKIVAWAKGVGIEAARGRMEGREPGLGYKIADKLVYSKVRDRLGLERCRLCVTSAAPIARATLEFFHSLGLPIYEVYGMSECTGPATTSMPKAFRIGKVGKVMPGTELKIAEDGEVCMRGDHVFLGYYKDEASTREALDAEGWLHSGDVGQIDSQGFLQITDRKKDLIITAGGKNVAPQNLEALLKGIAGIGQTVVLGDRMKYLAALLTIDPEAAARVAAECGARGSTPADLATDPAFAAHVQKGVDAVNSQLAKYETIKRWKLLPGEFTIDGGELTPTMKIKRKVIRDKYATEIAALFPPDAAEAISA